MTMQLMRQTDGKGRRLNAGIFIKIRTQKPLQYVAQLGYILSVAHMSYKPQGS